MDYKHASWFTDYHKRKSRCYDYRDKKKEGGRERNKVRKINRKCKLACSRDYLEKKEFNSKMI